VFGRPAGRPVRCGAVDSSLEPQWSYADARVCSRAKTGLVLRDFKILFGSLFSIIPRAWLAGFFFPIRRGCRMLESDGRGQRLVPSVFWFVYFVLSQGEYFGFKSSKLNS
jgi:hypothetical protein